MKKEIIFLIFINMIISLMNTPIHVGFGMQTCSNGWLGEEIRCNPGFGAVGSTCNYVCPHDPTSPGRKIIPNVPVPTQYQSITCFKCSCLNVLNAMPLNEKNNNINSLNQACTAPAQPPSTNTESEEVFDEEY
jgi:hypothetical protein